MSVRKSLLLVTPPVEEPIDLATAKLHCRVPASDTSQDSMISSYIAAARIQFERDTERALLLQTRRQGFACFADIMPLTGYPIKSVVDIRYIDSEGAEQVLDPASYLVYEEAHPGFVSRPSGSVWPVVDAVPLPVSITYTCGDATPADVGELHKQAILLLVSHWYENRTAVVVGASNEVPLAYESIMRSSSIRLTAGGA